jgi:hypothetical protein
MQGHRFLCFDSIRDYIGLKSFTHFAKICYLFIFQKLFIFINFSQL